MPATYAHKKFGREIAALSGEQFPEIAAHEKAFALGLHGPDPLFYYKPLKKNAVKKKGDLLHEERAADFFTAARPGGAARRIAPIFRALPATSAWTAYATGKWRGRWS